MSDLLSRAEVRRVSPFISIWWKPRQTIEAIVMDQPDRLAVLLLAALGSTTSIAGTLLEAGLNLTDWPMPAIYAVGGPVLGVISLYINGWIVGWFGRIMGGRASNAEVRAVFAWGALPLILGFVLTLMFGAALRFIGSTSAWRLPEVNYLSFIFGLWSIIIILLMLSRVERLGFWRTITVYCTVALALPVLLALFIRTFLFQSFSLPSNSMTPTLLAGDYMFATKYAYGYSRYSFPFSPPLFSGRVLSAMPARGDVIVFRLPKDTSVDYIKRVVGLPGDRIQMKEGLLYINDAPVQRERLSDFIGEDPCGPEATARVKRWKETLPNGVSYETLDCVDNGFYDNTNIYAVPPGHIFVLGDNRDNSSDSRVLSAVGYVPLENVVGRAGLVYFSVKPSGEARTGRIGTVIR